MRIIVERTRTELLGICVGIPIVGATISYIFSFSLIDWNSISIFIATVWWIDSVNILNKQRNEFDLSLSKIAAIVMLLILIIDILIFDINGSTNRSTFAVILNIVFPLCGFYLVYILTRVYGLNMYRHDPRGLEIFPTFIYFILFPIGIWKFQTNIAKIAKRFD